MVQTALGHRLPADPWAQPLLGGLEGTADPGKGQTILDAGTVGWGLAEARPGPRVSPLTREPWKRHVPPRRKRWRKPPGEPRRVVSGAGLKRAHSGCCSGALSGSLARWLPRPPTVLVVLFLGRAALRSPPAPHMWEPQP